MRKLMRKMAVVGHCCLDESVFGSVPDSGHLQIVDPVEFSIGGVSNVAVGASILGLSTIMVSLRGDDERGQILENLFKEFPRVELILPVSKESRTSHSIILNRPGKDRAIIHHPGCNDTMSIRDIPFERIIKEAGIVHYGYPTLMREMRKDYGRDLAKMFRGFQESGLLTSMDLSMVNSNSEAAAADWWTILQEVLPYVDFFMPSINEIIELVHLFQSMRIEVDNPNVWRKIAGVLTEWGAKVVVLKLGKKGLFAYTGENPNAKPSWRNKRYLSVPFKEIEMVGAIGSGDAAIAGFLTGVLQNLPLPECLMWANLTSSSSVEAAGATGGIRSMDSLLARLKNGWESFPLPVSHKYEWELTKYAGVYSPTHRLY